VHEAGDQREPAQQDVQDELRSIEAGKIGIP